jgi:hypothetical protein
MEDYAQAASRHFSDSDRLAKALRWGNAGHLVGFAAECAIKYRIETLRPASGAPHGHFPALLDIARKHLRNRRDTTMHSVLKISNLMKGWEVDLRYAADAAVGKTQYEAWRAHAVRVLGAAGVRQ